MMGQVFTLPNFVSNLIACHPKRADATGLFSLKLISARKQTNSCLLIQGKENTINCTKYYFGREARPLLTSEKNIIAEKWQCFPCSGV